jgi:hypothetical protein
MAGLFIIALLTAAVHTSAVVPEGTLNAAAAFGQVSHRFLAATQMTVASADGADTSASRVRSTDRAILEALEEGRVRSATFRALLETIEHSDGIVYVEFGFCAFGHLDGCLLPFIASTQSDRYIRIVVTSDTSSHPTRAV